MATAPGIFFWSTAGFKTASIFSVFVFGASAAHPASRAAATSGAMILCIIQPPRLEQVLVFFRVEPEALHQARQIGAQRGGRSFHPRADHRLHADAIFSILFS